MKTKESEQKNSMKLFIGCSSRLPQDKSMIEDTVYICKKLSQEKVILQFGAASTGLMGICYNHFQKIGVQSYTIKKYIDDLKNLNSRYEEILDTTMERTKSLYMDSDVLLILPGGTGTVSEIFAMIEENRSIEHPKPMFVYNPKGYYQLLLDWIHKAIELGMNDTSILDYFILCNTKEDVVKEVMHAFHEIREK